MRTAAYDMIMDATRNTLSYVQRNMARKGERDEKSICN